MQIFKNFKSSLAQDMSAQQVADMIRNDQELKKSTILYRDLMARGHEKAAKEVKENTPQVAVSFKMEGGKGKENCGECLYHVMIDFDAKNPDERLSDEELERVIYIMRTSNKVRLGYESISGLGYHIVVAFVLPDGITIDMKHDAKRSEEIYTRAYRSIANLYSVYCGHQMDMECKNVNRMMGLSHDPNVVCCPNARYFRLTREQLGIDADGNLIKMKTPRKALDKKGNRISIHLGDNLERAVKMVEESGINFTPGNRHNFVMRIGFILNRMGVDEDEAAEALDDEYLGRMDGRPSGILHSCYKSASDEFGIWIPSRSSKSVNTDIISNFLKKKELKFDVIKQITLEKTKGKKWEEMDDRMENDLYIECCTESGINLSMHQFHAVLNSSAVPEVNPLREYVCSLPEWTPDMPNYIDQVASMVHTSSEEEDALWHQCFIKWFVAMVAGWTTIENVNHQVIVLIGRQGIYKSTWIRSLLPPQLANYVSDMLEVEHLDKDEQLRSVEYGLINLDEIDKLSERELNKLKAQVTTTHVDVRAAFGRNKKKRVRVASYAASGNKKEFLTDQTGNRRWLPFNVTAIDSPYKNKLPYEGMYAQALYLMKNGFNFWFDLDDIKALEGHIEEFMVTQNEEELIPIYFSPAQVDDAGVVFLTLSEIAAKIVAYGNLKKTPDNRRLGAIMTKLGFIKERVGHDNRCGYYVREHTQAEIDRIRHPESF